MDTLELDLPTLMESSVEQGISMEVLDWYYRRQFGDPDGDDRMAFLEAVTVHQVPIPLFRQLFQGWYF